MSWSEQGPLLLMSVKSTSLMNPEA